MAGELYIGIDVSKDSLEVAFGCDGEVRRWPTRTRAIMALAAELKALGPKLVVMEASGGIRANRGGAFVGSGTAGGDRQPQPGARFRQRHGPVCQDRSAGRADHCALGGGQEPTGPPAARCAGRELSELLTRRRQLLEMLVAERQRLAQT